MWNPFRRKTNKAKRQARRELHSLAMQFGILDEFARRGLLYWKEREKLLLIETSLATVKIAEGEEAFRHFLSQVADWQNYRLINAAYEKRRTEIETEAVRRAQKDNPFLSPPDIHRIRQNARRDMPEIPYETLDRIEEFDMFIITATATSAKDATEQNGQLVAVGHYDGRRVEMAMFNDVKEQFILADNDNEEE